MEETERDDPGSENPVLSALAELREPDPRSVLWIVGGAAAAEDAADRDKRVMAHLDVPASVPEPVRKSFDRIRAIFRQGLGHEICEAGDAVLDREVARRLGDERAAQLVFEVGGGSGVDEASADMPQEQVTGIFAARRLAMRPDFPDSAVKIRRCF